MRHIISPLFHHRMMPLLVVLQVALACAIACNALFLLQQKLVPILTPDGVGDPGHLIVAWDIASRDQPWSAGRLLETEQALRAVPEVVAVSTAGSLPMQTNTQMNGDVIGEGTNVKANVAVYVGDHLVRTLGLQLVAGRDFSADEEATHYKNVGFDVSGPAIISRALADHLFPGGHALGQVIRIKDTQAGQRTVVGVVAHLMRNTFGSDERESIDYSMLFPGIPGNWPMPVFGVRTTANADVERVRKAVESTIQRELGSEMVQGFDAYFQTYSTMRDHALARSKAAVWLLSGVSLVVLLVTLVGIMGLTGYWVQQRTRQIGIRRALGARRHDILRHLQWENALVVGLGVVLGLFAAYAINLWLMQHYELSRLPWIYLPFGAVLMLLLGQLAVLGPALRAAAVPPVVATRSI